MACLLSLSTDWQDKDLVPSAALSPSAHRPKWGLEGEGDAPGTSTFNPDEVPITDRRVAVRRAFARMIAVWCLLGHP